jgi:hypothetical protein
MNDSTETQAEEEVNYSEQGFLGRSIVFGIIATGLTLWLTDAPGWQAWLVASLAGFALIGISMVQATLIENGTIIIIMTGLMWFASTTPYFEFHWSVIITAIMGAINGMGGRESAMRTRFRNQYGEEEYKKRYVD